VKLPEDAKGPLASGVRWSVILIAILASPLLFFFSSSSTAVFGAPQSSPAGNHFGFSSAREGDEQAYLSSLTPEGALSSRKVVIPTRENLQLTLKADCANVEIFTDGANEVSYDVRVNPRVAGADANTLLRDFALMARNTPRGVVILGRPSRGSDCSGRVTYEVHVPRRYDLNVSVQSGDIVAQDIDGGISFTTGGGNIRVGRVGTGGSRTKALESKTFAAKLETGGGDISIGDIAGGLRAMTAGGQISAVHIHGPAVLSTGGGDIHVGHVFGEARFASGGGDIIAQKVEGGLWADTAGGRIQLGDANRTATATPHFPAGQKDAFLVIPRRPDNRSEVAAISNLADINELARLFDPLLWGGIPVDPADQQKRLVNPIAPDYPDVARLAGIDGDVTLRIFVARDGSIRGITPISGPPVLARAAIRAVEQWRYAPAIVDGRPVDVVTTVRLAFRLRP
jgi:TonB family protein